MPQTTSTFRQMPAGIWMLGIQTGISDELLSVLMDDHAADGLNVQKAVTIIELDCPGSCRQFRPMIGLPQQYSQSA